MQYGRTKPVRRIAISLLLASVPTALLLVALNSLLRPGLAPDNANVIVTTLTTIDPDEKPPAAIEKPAETPQQAQTPATPEPTPVMAPEQNPAAANVAVTPDSKPVAVTPDSVTPTINWWRAKDRFFEEQRNPEGEDYAGLPPASVPPAIPRKPPVDPKLGRYNSAGELVRDISEHCRAEQRDAIPNDGFVPPPLIFCKRPPQLALPLRRPRYLDNDAAGEREPETLARYAYTADK